MARRLVAPLMAFALILVTTSAGTARAVKDGWREDPLADQQWHLDVIGAEQAWMHTKGKGAVIAILDSGVDLDHPDLKPNLFSQGIDFTDPKDKDGANDESGHGTHVAGIAAARGGNGIGVTGVAPRAKILPIRLSFPDGGILSTSVAEGIRRATQLGADVISMSFGDHPILFPTEYEEEISAAIDYAYRKGAVVVSIAQNDFVLTECTYPGRDPKALCVGATNAADTKAAYSNFDARMSANYLVAPGGEISVHHGLVPAACDLQILSTAIHVRESLPLILPERSACSPEEGYDWNAGTSMAAPVVSGVVALVMSLGIDNRTAIDIVLETAVDLGVPGRDPIYGYGRVDAARAVDEAVQRMEAR